MLTVSSRGRFTLVQHGHSVLCGAAAVVAHICVVRTVAGVGVSLAERGQCPKLRSGGLSACLHWGVGPLGRGMGSQEVGGVVVYTVRRGGAFLRRGVGVVV